ncbi:MAG TPA: bifunctional glycosyltransferase/class I SAM-dependent methyltransferase [Aliidongia sp.]|nr:bifunctional glycosyltransferase/class I SAM-dependent methyltransferase [Aliidongia sp.]
MGSAMPEPEQLSLPAIGAGTPRMSVEESARIAELLDRLDRAEARMADAIAHIRQEEAAAQRGRNPLESIEPRLWLRWLVGLLLCQVAPPAAAASPAPPRLSIVTIAGGDTDATARTLESAIAQNYPAELIVVDLGSDPAWARRYEAALSARIPAAGASAETGFALGLARATGDFLTVLAPGDTLLPGTLGRVGAHAARHPDDRILVLERVIERSVWRFAGGPVEPASLAAVPTLLPQGAFVRRHDFDRAGGLDIAFGGMPAPALWPRLLRQHGARLLPGQGVVLPVAEPAERELPLYATGTSFWHRLRIRLGRRWRLAFPADEAGPVPAAAEPAPLVAARCPITDRLPLALLFSTPDTRFAEPGMSEIWYHPASHCAAMGPPLDPEEQRRLTRRDAGRTGFVIEPDPGAPSPFRHWRGRSSLLAQLGRLNLPGSLAGAFGRWADPTEAELRRMLRGLLPEGVLPRLLEINCLDGSLLDRFQAEGWHGSGTASEAEDAEAARAKGHEIWQAEPIDLLRVIPPERRFDVVFMSMVLEREIDPLTVLQRAARLVEPDGVLVLSAANLDSAQIDCFGPSWAHWHAPYNRFLLSKRTVAQMAAASGLELVRSRSFSHPYWSWMSLRLNASGLAAAIPHGIKPDAPTASRAATLALASRLLHDWRGRGDYFYAVLRPARG